MNEGRLRSVYLLGIAISAYALWYFVSSGAAVPAVAFVLLTGFFLLRLRTLTAGS
ncbi:hypothetical protein [Natrinema caseinilyticum]|uniref:hypothetical protein n=1 Tax=Natrinema caseinilyticum TaxID=2961570 RepID=UPI0020C47FB9|nr:hypothetical protein [Natrinema caseinilyticum]